MSLVKGVLFIGDPHAYHGRPGRRMDNYPDSVLGKLARTSEICWENSYLPVILGDLFHIAKENNLVFLCRLYEVLSSFPVIPLVLGGNHDKSGKKLEYTDALSLFAQTGVVEVMDGPGGFWRSIETDSGIIHLWGVPYGAQIPDSIEPKPGGKNIAVTHADLAFQGAYPGAQLLKEIEGCDMAVNGHMHMTCPSVRKGLTVWHNPGNIEPITVDCKDHKPAVWSWRADQDCDNLTRIDLPHDQNCFNLTGITVEASDSSAAVEGLRQSQFAELLSQDEFLGAQASENDGEAFLEDIAAGLEELEVSTAVSNLLMNLAKDIAVR